MSRELLTIDKAVQSQSEIIMRMAKELNNQNGRMDTIEDEVSRIRVELDNEMFLVAAQRRALQKTVAKKVYENAGEDPGLRPKWFAAIYRDLKDKYRVGSYSEIPRKQFNEAIVYVEEWFPLTPIK